MAAENRNTCVTMASSLECMPEMQMPTAGPTVLEPEPGKWPRKMLRS